MPNELPQTSDRDALGSYGAAGILAEAGTDLSLDQLESAHLDRLIDEQMSNLEQVVDRITELAQRESETRGLLVATREQLAARDSALEDLRGQLEQIAQQRDLFRSLVREAVNEIESRDMTIESLRRKLKKCKS